jgi:GT2 family glycosyltransferase
MRGEKWSRIEMKDIWIVILNWNGADDTIDCIASFAEQQDNQRHHIIVIDNASRDDSMARIMAWAEQAALEFSVVDYNPDAGADHPLLPGDTPQYLTLVQSSQNLGFCDGNNLGAGMAFANGADFALILNNDTIVDPLFITELQQVLAKDEGNTLYSPQIGYESNRDTIWWYGGRFSRLLSPTYVAQGEPLRRDVEAMPKTEWVSGCATLMSRKLYDRLGLYDPIFFIWCEEWDLSLRAAREGIPMLIIPNAIVYHKVGKSLGLVSPLTFFYSMRNMLILRQKHLAWPIRLPFNAVYIPHKFLQAIRLSLKQRNRLYILGFFDALDLRRGGGIWHRQASGPRGE